MKLITKNNLEENLKDFFWIYWKGIYQKRNRGRYTKAEVVYVEEATEGYFTAGSVGDTSGLSFKLIYIEDNGSIAILNRGWTESNSNHYWESNWDFGDTNTGDYISNPGNESLYLLMVRKLLGVHYEEISHD